MAATGVVRDRGLDAIGHVTDTFAENTMSM
jgi:hypothetical protein